MHHVKRVRGEQSDPRQKALYWRAIQISIAGNVLLAVSKGIIAWLSDSSAVFSDAANSFSDTLYTVLMGIGLYLAQQPADESHPQGHSRFEPLVSLLIALAMGAAGLTALREGFQRFASGVTPVDLGWPTAALLGSAGIKVAMYLAVERIGRTVHSPALQASARDNLSDVLTSTAALMGVWGSRWMHPLLDPVAGVAVSLWIFRSAWEILSENLGYLTGRGASSELVDQVISTAMDMPGVEGVHQVIADHVGPQVRVDMHVDVDGNLSLFQAHRIAEQVRTRIETLQAVDLAFIHIEPATLRAGEQPDEQIDDDSAAE